MLTIPKLFSIKRGFKNSKRAFSSGASLFGEYVVFLFFYVKKKFVHSGHLFEKQKNVLVSFFMMKRGRYNRPFLHVTAMVVMALGVLIAPLIADTFPIFSTSVTKPTLALAQSGEQSIIVGDDVFQTKISQKPRDEIITYSVQNGDTMSTIAEKFGISTDTIKWANDLTSDNITVGDELKILPVTGMSHKVASGDTVYSIAKKYDSNPQAIVDFPFNDFANPETFSLVIGQIVIVPDGIKPSEKPTFVRRQYIAAGPAVFSNSGIAWPVSGLVSQFAAWYHMALDITSPVGTPIVASQNGTITKALAGTWDGGYGTNIMISDGNGTETLYAHMSALNVGVGDSVVAGKTVIGWVGLTGRTTGAHVHFEIRKNGALVNPLPYLQ